MIRKRNQGESSRVITLLTKEEGIVDVLVRGIRKPTYRYAGVMEPFNLTGVVLRPSQVYYMLDEATLVKSYGMLDSHLRGVGLGNVMLEVVNQAARDDEAGKYFDLLNDYLLAYETNLADLNQRESLLIFLSSYILSVLALAGRMPIVDGCWVCGLDRGGEWQATTGGLSHRSCLGNNRVCHNITQTAVDGLKVVSCQACGQLFEQSWSEKQAKEIFAVVLFWYHSFYEKQVKSLDFLDEVYRDIMSGTGEENKS